MSMEAAAFGKPMTLARERFERIYKTIRDRVCLLEYEPGARLGDEDLAREFGVSRTPLRRVLSRLESEGLLESRHGVGTFVTDVDLDGLLQVYQLRMQLAELIGKLDPIPRQSHDLARVRDIIARCEDDFLVANAIHKGAMNLIDAERAETLYAAMGPAVEMSGGSAGNTAAGIA